MLVTDRLVVNGNDYRRSAAEVQGARRVRVALRASVLAQHAIGNSVDGVRRGLFHSIRGAGIVSICQCFVSIQWLCLPTATLRLCSMRVVLFLIGGKMGALYAARKGCSFENVPSYCSDGITFRSGSLLLV